MKTVCQKSMCTGCMLCSNLCVHNAIHIEKKINYYDAIIDSDKCIDCNLCRQKCPVNNTPDFHMSNICKQGWAIDEEIRRTSASGGLATSIAKEFIKSGGVVAGCLFDGGDFVFEIIENEKDINKISGSKYVKSNPDEIYGKIRYYLNLNVKVLFIGLPCQVAAVINFVGKMYINQLYTIDLICHGTPSVDVLKLFLKEYDIKLEQCKNILFRMKNRFQIIVDGHPLEPRGVCDSYTVAFLNSLSYTENCFSCQYARQERISDLTLGDSWGSELEKEQVKNGLSLIMCQTAKGEELISSCNVVLRNVDMENAIIHNAQLKSPSTKHKGYFDFFESLNKGKTFKKATRKYCKYICLKQVIKKILISLKVLKY